MQLKQKVYEFKEVIYSHKYSKYLIVILIAMTLLLMGYTLYGGYQLFQINQGLANAKVIMQDYSSESINGGIVGQAINNVTSMAMENVLNKAIKARNWKILKVLIGFIMTIPFSYLSFLIIRDEKMKIIFKK